MSIRNGLLRPNLPTEVPHEFAESFAPTAKLRIKEITIPKNKKVFMAIITGLNQDVII